MNDWVTMIVVSFPPEWVRSALVLALFAAWVVVGLYSYLNRQMQRPYFRLWTVAWLYYSLYLACLIGLEETPEQPFLVMVRRASIGISALCMFWGSFEFTGRARPHRELGLAVLMMTVWSAVAAYRVAQPMWITVPVFLLLAAASGYTAALYSEQRGRYVGARLLAIGFASWALHLLVFPFQSLMAAGVIAAGYLVSALLALFIALSMMTLVLEEARAQTEAMAAEFQQGVAQRRLLEQEVAASAQRYRLLFDAASDAIFLVDLQSLRVLEANEAAGQLTGIAAGMLVGRRLSEFCPVPSGGDGGLLANRRAVEALCQAAGGFELVRPDGSRVCCEAGSSLIVERERVVLQLSVRDVTERKRMEQQLRRAERLTALGKLVAGVAHELNNPLAVVMGYAQILSKNGAVDEKSQRDILKILHESERAARIVRNLLSFARPREPQLAPVDINAVIADAVEASLPQLQAAHIELITSLARELPRTLADATQLEQVLGNLITNAIQALAQHDGPRTLRVSSERCADTIRIRVADTGPGIPVEIQDRIFDPYFTTKPPGQGTGLGLSICHSIVEEHGGKLWVESRPGEGACFTVELPLREGVAQPPEPPATPPQQSRPSAATGSPRVLVVDDEPGIVDVLKQALGAAGYCVDTAAEGASGLELIRDGGYDAIITDLCMPGMSGEQLYGAVREFSPELARRIVFLTGDTVSPATRAFLERTGNRWLSKPFNIGEVERVLETVLREPATASCGAG